MAKFENSTALALAHKTTGDKAVISVLLDWHEQQQSNHGFSVSNFPETWTTQDYHELFGVEQGQLLLEAKKYNEETSGAKLNGGTNNHGTSNTVDGNRSMHRSDQKSYSKSLDV